MNNIVNPNRTHSKGTVNKIGKAVAQHDIVIGAVHEPSHWTIVAVYPERGEVIYMNSFGEHKHVMATVLDGWRNFMQNVTENKKKWKVKQLPHPMQHDSHSCGLFVVKFAEHLLLGSDMHLGDVESTRLTMGRALLASSEDISRRCAICTLQCDGRVQCNCPLPRAFHAKCLEKGIGIFCDLCSIRGDQLLRKRRSAVFDLDKPSETESDDLSLPDLTPYTDVLSLPDLTPNTDNEEADNLIPTLVEMGFRPSDAAEAAKKSKEIGAAIDFIEDRSRKRTTCMSNKRAAANRKRARSCSSDTSSVQESQTHSTQTQHMKMEPKDTSQPEMKKLRQEPFVLQIKQKRVKVCKGCKHQFGEPRAPANVVIQHKDNYPFFDKKQGSWRDSWANGYFHANVACITPRFSDFDPQGVAVPPETLKDLTAAHVKYCRQHGILLPLGVLHC
ncbi:uncharacterized protein LOC144926325 [Branchiostoma floridae x Branchiostoma belcheri]